MSLGKDKILHVTKDDLAKPEVIDTLLVDTDKYGILLPNGEINWDCPCLGGMPQGPCGQEFKDAFSCFHFRYWYLDWAREVQPDQCVVCGLGTRSFVVCVCVCYLKLHSLHRMDAQRGRP